jgi:hypothetical protein
MLLYTVWNALNRWWWCGRYRKALVLLELRLLLEYHPRSLSLACVGGLWRRWRT